MTPKKAVIINDYRFVFFYLFLFYISSLRATFTFNNLESYFLTFFKRFKSFFLNSGIMYENIISFFNLNETVTFFCVKPFYYSVFHVNNPPKNFHVKRVNTNQI